MARGKYTQFVHEYEGEYGVTRYAVAMWDNKMGTWTRPLTARERKANGGSVTAEYGPLWYLGGYADRKKALAQARKLFGYLYDPLDMDITKRS